MVLQLLGTSCWYHDNCITKLWNLSSYFLYLYMVFIQMCFHLEQHCFHLDRQFSCSPNISNWLSRVPTQYSLVIHNFFSSWLSCTLSIRLWFPSNTTYGFIYKHIILCRYNISQKNLFDSFYHILFTDGQTKWNHKTIELRDSTYVYIYIFFYSLIKTCIFRFFDVRTKLNNNILHLGKIFCCFCRLLFKNVL